jgi:RNA polymerase sigma factor (sigma-70 family)
MPHQRSQEEARAEFDVFLQRYLYMLSPNIVDSIDCASFVKNKKNRDLQLTLSYLTRFESYKKLCKFNLLWKHPYVVKETVDSVRETLANDMEEEDIRQTIEVSFMTAFSKFDMDRGVPLKNYLYHYFKWIFVNDIRKNMWKAPIAVDPQITSAFEGTWIENDRAEMKQIVKNIDKISTEHPANQSQNQLLTESIDWKWIDGECGWVFQCLSPHERLILKKYYVDETNWREISEELGVEQNKLKAIVAGIHSKLKKAMEDE